MMVVLLAPRFSHIGVACDSQTYLLVVSTSVRAYGYHWWSWDPLIWSKSRKELSLVLTYKQVVIFELFINADVDCGPLTMECVCVPICGEWLRSGLLTVTSSWAVSFCVFLWAPTYFIQGSSVWELCPPRSAELGGWWVDTINLDFQSPLQICRELNVFSEL